VTAPPERHDDVRPWARRAAQWGRGASLLDAYLTICVAGMRVPCRAAAARWADAQAADL